MDRDRYIRLASESIQGIAPSREICQTILDPAQTELLPLLDAAFEVRKHYHQKRVTVHILNNAQSGHCPEDCGYCSQAGGSDAEIESYGIKPDHEILEEARLAYQGGAFRYCMVYAGRGPSDTRLKKLAGLIKQIKDKYPLEICVSAGLVDQNGARMLKEAGLDRLNHNLNTSESFYPEICTTHTWQDRLNTLQAAGQAGLQTCSGLIVGMGETQNDVIDVAFNLRELKVPSIPVNFLVPIEGNTISQPQGLSPEYCLRVLCLYRFVNPTAEIRAAAGREGHLRGMEVMALYPASSLFLDGYLTTRGGTRRRTLQMIRDAGFDIVSDIPLDDLIEREAPNGHPGYQIPDLSQQSIMKDLGQLRPAGQK
jgi:biotin synthase